MTSLFALATFCSAALLFMVEPMGARILLPVLGGSPVVWSTCIVFFQLVLLIGYLYAHVLATMVPARWQPWIHAGVLAAAAAALPWSTGIAPHDGSDPRLWVLRTLTGTIGLPFFALSSTAPLLQRWTSSYALYAASNAGSLSGLFGFLVIEPFATLTGQLRGWSTAFIAVAALMTACAFLARTRGDSHSDAATAAAPPLTWPDAAMWIVLALVPSVLLLGVTHHLATDVVSAPFLWVVPLAIYLVTFIAAFATTRFGTAHTWSLLAAAATLLVAGLSLAHVHEPLALVVFAHLALFGILSMACHSRLADRRPHPSHLTSYFVCIALGGVLGSIFVALAAPRISSTVFEYPVAIVAAILLLPQLMDGAARPRLIWRAGAAVLCVLVMAASVVPTNGVLLHRERTFFGVHRVTAVPGGWHELAHGTTIHGVQARGELRWLPTAYFHPSGPIGDVVAALTAEKRFRDVGVIGLGTGALAAYAAAGVRMDFFEIDEAVIRIADEPGFFTYLTDARARPGATVRTFARDGRIGIREAPEASYDLIVIDAFTSDSVPTHLLTREAIAIYASRLKPRGVIAFHVSSYFFNLAPVLAKGAEANRLVAYGRDDQDVPLEMVRQAKRRSVWVLMARDGADLGAIARSAPRWVRIGPGRSSLWTDDYSNVLGSLLGTER